MYASYCENSFYIYIKINAKTAKSIKINLLQKS